MKIAQFAPLIALVVSFNAFAADHPLLQASAYVQQSDEGRFLTPNEARTVAGLRAAKGSKGSYVVSLDRAGLASAASLTVTLPSGETVRFVKTNGETIGDSTGWAGQTVDRQSIIGLGANKEGISGRIEHHDDIYMIRNVSAKYQTIGTVQLPPIESKDDVIVPGRN